MVLFIIGSNDLLQGADIQHTADKIIHLHEKIACNGIKTIGATIPPIQIDERTILQNFLKFNEMLAGLFDNHKIRYINTYGEMSYDKGLLKDEFDIGDGLHLTKSTYQVLAKEFCRVIHNEYMK